MKTLLVLIQRKRITRLTKICLKLIDQSNYKVYPIMEDYRIVFKSQDENMDVVVTLHEEV